MTSLISLKMKNFEVKQIDAAQTHYLRHQVLWPHILKEEDCVIDMDHREDAIHLGCFYGEEIVSIGSLFQVGSSKIQAEYPYRLRAMATDPHWRGKNAGKELILFAFDLLRKKKVDVLWCDARKVAVGFYTTLGFEILLEEYEVPRIGPHYFMWKKL